MKTKTPRTDAAQFIQHDMTAVVDADFARTLEAELAACKESLHLANGTANLALVHRDAAEAELADIRALANRRNKRDHSQDTTHQLVAALDQALDIAQAELADEAIALRDMMSERDAAEAELAAERARLDAVVANCWAVHSEGGSSFSVFSNVCGDYIATAQTYRAAIDAAMKEETK